MIPSFSRRRAVHWDSISTTPSAGCPRSRWVCETWEGRLEVHLSQTGLLIFLLSIHTEGLRRFYRVSDFHFLTFSCYRRRPLIRNEVYCDLFLKILGRVAHSSRSLA